VYSLAFKVRILNENQIAMHWWGDLSHPLRKAKSKLAFMEKARILYSHQFLSHPMLPLEAPVWTWNVNDPDPDFRKVSSQLKKRWTKDPVPMKVYIPTRKAINQFGGPGESKLPILGQQTHDLHLSQVYLWYLQTRPEQAKQWMGEEVFREDRAGEKLPDAMIQDEHGKPQLVVEFGGTYDPMRVEAFHTDCKKRNLPYELW
jgi:hypothetical protein